MYTTKEFEQAVERQGYELEHVYYTTRKTLFQAKGFVVKNNVRIMIRWNFMGKAFRSRGMCPEFDLLIEKEDEKALALEQES